MVYCHIFISKTKHSAQLKTKIYSLINYVHSPKELNQFFLHKLQIYLKGSTWFTMLNHFLLGMFRIVYLTGLFSGQSMDSMIEIPPL